MRSSFSTERYADDIFSATFFLNITNGNGDYLVGGVTDTADLGILLANFGAPGGADFNADLKFDGVVDTADLGILLSTFGVVCP